MNMSISEDPIKIKKQLESTLTQRKFNLWSCQSGNGRTKPIGESDTHLSLNSNKRFSSFWAGGTRREGGTTGAPGLESPGQKPEPLQRHHLKWSRRKHTSFSPFLLLSIILSLACIHGTQAEAIWHSILETYLSGVHPLYFRIEKIIGKE